VVDEGVRNSIKVEAMEDQEEVHVATATLLVLLVQVLQAKETVAEILGTVAARQVVEVAVEAIPVTVGALLQANQEMAALV
jgi:hypothetical protein